MEEIVKEIQQLGFDRFFVDIPFHRSDVPEISLIALIQFPDRVKKIDRRAKGPSGPISDQQGGKVFELMIDQKRNADIDRGVGFVGRADLIHPGFPRIIGAGDEANGSPLQRLRDILIRPKLAGETHVEFGEGFQLSFVGLVLDGAGQDQVEIPVREFIEASDVIFDLVDPGYVSDPYKLEGIVPRAIILFQGRPDIGDRDMRPIHFSVT